MSCSPVQAPVIGSLEFDTVLFSSVNIKSPALMQAQSGLPSLNILERNGDVHNLIIRVSKEGLVTSQSSRTYWPCK